MKSLKSLKSPKKKWSAIAVILAVFVSFGVGGFWGWFHFGYGMVPEFAVKSEVNRHVDTTSTAPVMGGFHADNCGSMEYFQRITYVNSGNDLYLVIKCRDDVIFGSSVNYSLITEGNYQINISVGYVDCILKSAAYIFIPDIGLVTAINIQYVSFIPEE